LEMVALVHCVDLGWSDRLASDCVYRMPRNDLFLRDAGIVYIDSSFLNLAGGQIPIFDCLRDIVLIHGLTEVVHVIGRNRRVLFCLFGLLLIFQLSWSSREADMHRIRIPRAHFGPLSPSRAVTFIDYYVREVILGVMGGQEISIAILILDAEGLIRCHVDAGVLRV